MKLKRLFTGIICICIVLTSFSGITVTTKAATVDGVTNKYTYVRMAPYWTASVVDNMAGGVAITIIERDYNYLYVQYNKDGITKRGYIPIADTSNTGYSWCNHTYFIPGNCYNTVTVYYGPGSTYSSCGTIYSGEFPLLVLEKESGYYYVQYVTNPTATGSTQPLYKRGWVNASYITLRLSTKPSYFSTDSSQYTLIRSPYGSYLTAVADSSQESGYALGLTTGTGDPNQQWIVYKYNYSNAIYYKIKSVSTGLFIQVQDVIPLIDKQLILTTESSPNKAQEFEIKFLNTIDSNNGAFEFGYKSMILPRSSGDFLAAQEYGTTIRQYRANSSYQNQWFYFDPIDNMWDGKYSSGRTNLTYYIDPSVLVGRIRVYEIESAANSWNGISNVSLTRVFSSAGADIVLKGTDSINNIEKLAGLCSPIVESTTDANNSNWYGVVLYINTYVDSEGYIADGKHTDSVIKLKNIQKTIAHEFGHAIKLRHHHEDSNPNDNYQYAYIKSIMNQGLHSDETTNRPISPSQFDQRALKLKWD